MNKTILYQLLALLLLFGITTTSNAQVTIGAGTQPSAFSVLELSTASTKGGLRLPHLTTGERNDLTNTAKFQLEKGETGLAKGLTIFNTITQCIEYWDTREWISLCTSSASFTFTNPNPPAIDADGGITAPNKPEGGGGCIQNPPYTVAIVAGIDYVVSPDIVTSPTTGEFQVEFYPNPTAFPRYVIVRVTDNCTNLFRDLSLQQLANETLCQGNPVTIPVINSKSGGAGIDATVCNGGEVPLWLTNTDATYTYIWTLNGMEIQGANGTTYTATKGGNYGVVVGAMGCMNGISATKKIVENKIDTAGPAPLITATNSGVICGARAVVLNAYNGTTPVAVDWYQDGVLITENATSKSINAAGDAGRWTAYASDPCGSKRSNELTVEFDNTTPSSLPEMTISINGDDITLNPEICKGGTMTVEVTNAADYAASNPKYTWLINGTKVSESTNPKVVINVPNDDNMTLEVQLVTSNNCPLSIDYSRAITSTELAKPEINLGVTEGFICATTQGVSLEADPTDGIQYEWIRNNVVKEQTTTNTVNYNEAGSYQVRYKIGNCWSPLSDPIELKYQAFLSLSWDNIPPKNEVVGTVLTRAAYTAPEAVSYTWTSSDPTKIKVTPLLGNPRFATIEYLALGPARITVTATNECGSANLPADIETVTGCTPITNLNFLQKPTTGVSGVALTYQLGYSGGVEDANIRFDWVVKDASNTAIRTSNLSGDIGKEFTYTFPTNGKYTVSVTAYNVCQALADRATISQAVTINPSEGEIGLITPAPAKYSMSGVQCFDIAKSGTDLANRKSSFLDANDNEKYEFTYELLGTPMVEISVFTLGAGADILLAESPTLSSTGSTITLKFSKSGTRSVNATGLKFDLVALFKDIVGGTQYKLVKSIVVKNQTCCGAATISGGWLTFMCHNLGADVTLDPFTHNVGLYGDLYQWGRKADGHEKLNSGKTVTLATTNIPGHNKFIVTNVAPHDWRSGGGNLNRWGSGSQAEIMTKGANDPCPTGWIVPSQKQWASISTTMNRPNKIVNTGKGIMIGDMLYLPATGYMRGENRWSSLTQVGEFGRYWAATTDPDPGSVNETNSYMLHFGSDFGSDYCGSDYVMIRSSRLSVRCVKQ